MLERVIEQGKVVTAAGVFSRSSTTRSAVRCRLPREAPEPIVQLVRERGATAGSGPNRALAAAHEAPDGRHQLVGELFG
jgi:hypothetical protein